MMRAEVCLGEQCKGYNCRSSDSQVNVGLEGPDAWDGSLFKLML